jgi:glycosyltransferase involved in cell wall biosynthesis
LNLLGGGAERQLVQLVRNWRPDWQIEVLLLEGRGVWFDDLPAAVPVHRLSAEMPAGGMTRILWAAATVRRLRKFLDAHRYDVAVAMLWLPALVAALALRRRAERPFLFWSVQGDVVNDFSALRGGWIRRWLLRAVLPGRVAHFIACSEGVRRRTARWMGIREDEISVIPNSVDVRRVTELATAGNEVRAERRRLRVVSIGRLVEQKGMDVLLRGLAAAKSLGVEVECFILGEGTDRVRLERLAARLEIADRVQFLGYRQNPFAWLRTADVFASASRWEPFGIVIAEALAAGVPVVATATDGAREILSDGVDGLMIPVDDPDALAAALARLAGDAELRRRLRERGSEKATQFDAPQIAGRYGALLERLVAAAGSEPRPAAAASIGFGGIA